MKTAIHRNPGGIERQVIVAVLVPLVLFCSSSIAASREPKEDGSGAILLQGVLEPGQAKPPFGSSLSVSYYPGEQPLTITDELARVISAFLEAKGSEIVPAGETDLHVYFGFGTREVSAEQFYGLKAKKTGKKKNEEGQRYLHYLGLTLVRETDTSTPLLVWKGEARWSDANAKNPDSPILLLTDLASATVSVFGENRSWFELLPEQVHELGLCGGTPVPASGSEDRTISKAKFASLLFASLDGEPTACPERITSGSSGLQANCARMNLRLNAVKRGFESLARSALLDSPLSSMPWRQRDGLWSRYAMVDGEALRLVFAADEGWLAVVPGTCLDPEQFDALDVRVADGERVSVPESIFKVQPDYPERARTRRTNGKAFVEAIILKDGSVGGVCVLFAEPEEYGFAEAAVEAVTLWKFKPACEDGAPVNVHFLTTLQWELR